MCDPVAAVTRGTLDMMTFGTAEIGGISSKAGEAASGVVGSITGAGDGMDMPGYPGLTPQEAKILNEQKMTVDQLHEMVTGDVKNVQANRKILEGVTGLFDDQGNINQDALKSLQTRVQGQMQQRDVIGQKALDYMGSFFDTSAGPMETEITKAAQSRYLRALKGDLPVSQALDTQFDKQFQDFKEAAGARGIKIEGDSFKTATSESTAGIRMIGEMQKNYNLAVEQERQTELSTGANTLGMLQNINVSNLNAATSVGYQPAALGALQQAGTMGASLTPELTSLSSAQGGILGFLRGDTMGAYNAQVQQQMAEYQAKQQQMQGIGSLVGTLGAAYLTGGTSLAMLPLQSKQPVMKYSGANNAVAGAAA